MFTDDSGDEYSVILNQHAYIPEPKYFDTGVPGRLYFDDNLIEIRSPQEKNLLKLLKSAELRSAPKDDLSNEQIELSPNIHVFGDDIKRIFNQSPEENLHSMLNNVINFVESDEYVVFAEKVKEKLNEQ